MNLMSDNTIENDETIMNNNMQWYRIRVKINILVDIDF
jgi:hypothetical protein